MRPCRFVALLLVVGLAGVRAQMQVGANMAGFAEVFGVQLNQRDYAFDVSLLELSAPGGVYFPGELPKIRFQVQSRLDQPVDQAGFVEAIGYGTRGREGDIWTPELFKIDDLGKFPITVKMAPRGFCDLEVAVPTPERFGGYALIVDLGPLGRQFLTSYVRTFAAVGRAVQYPKQALEYMPPEVLERLGVQAVRFGVAFNAAASDARRRQLAELEREFQAMHAHRVTCVAEIGAGNAPQPLGQGRPHLTAEGIMKGGKTDLVWLPEADDDYEAFVYELAATYGWPKGPITGFMLWNEPWEGLSISGWQADLPRYRELYGRMYRALDKARREAGVDVLIGGCDSSSNTWDKLLAEGPEASPLWPHALDFCSIHYQGMNAPALYPAWRERTFHKGRVLIWDTESWVANTDDRFAGVVATNRAAGYDRALGIYGGNVMANLTHGGTLGRQRIRAEEGGRIVQREVDRPVFAWPPAAAVGAVQHFIGEREFKEILFRVGLPWIYVFDGLDDEPEDGTVVVLGDIGSLFQATDQVLYRTVRSLAEVQAKAALQAELAGATPERAAALRRELARSQPVRGCSLTLSDPAGRFRLHDFYGNPVPAVDQRIVIPLDTRGFFLRGDGRPGSFDALLAALRSARIEGFEPVELIPVDPIRPIDQRPTIGLRVTNILNRPIEGALRVAVEGLTIDAPDRLALAPHEVRELSLPVTGGAANPTNAYPARLTFDAGADGLAVHEETLRVNYIAKRTIKVDGDLSDWAGALPQTIVTDEAAERSLTEAAWLPMVPFAAGRSGGLATAWLAYDEQGFYLAAKVADETPQPGLLRFAQRDDDAFFYPEVSWRIDSEASCRTLTRARPARANDTSRLKNPVGEGRVDDWWVNDRELAILSWELALDTGGATRQVALYLPPDDWHPNGLLVRLLDGEGKEVHRQALDNLYAGIWLVYRVAGRATLRVSTRGDWYPARAAGLFIDPAEGAGNAFLKLDWDTRGDWPGVYGAAGWLLPGGARKLPEGLTVDFPERLAKQELRWPEGVRRYSYRQWPQLPNGHGPGQAFDNLQIAFNAIPDERDEWLLNLPGRMPRFIGYKCTDYEYALNPVAPDYGGGTEVWRLQVPGMPRKHFYPRQPAHAKEGAVTDAQLVIRHEGGQRLVEAFLPWSEIPDVKACLDRGEPVKFSYRVNSSDGGPTMELARGRGVSRRNAPAFHVDWTEHWANELAFGWER